MLVPGFVRDDKSPQFYEFYKSSYFLKFEDAMELMVGCIMANLAIMTTNNVIVKMKRVFKKYFSLSNKIALTENVDLFQTILSNIFSCTILRFNYY